MQGLGQAKRLDDAFELLEKMEAGSAPGQPHLTDVHLNTLVNACAEAGEALRARGLLSRFKSFGQGLGPSAFTYNLLIKVSRMQQATALGSGDLVAVAASKDDACFVRVRKHAQT